MSLHLVFSQSGWLSCEVMRAPEDPVVFIGDGAYSARHKISGNVFVIAQDLAIRGIHAGADIQPVDYPDLVTLCTQHAPIVSWNG